MLPQAMQLMVGKIAAAMTLDGELSAEGLTAMADDEPTAIELARSISNAIDTTDIQRNWVKLESCRKPAANSFLPLGLADIELEPIDGLYILAIEPHLIARTIRSQRLRPEDHLMGEREPLSENRGRRLGRDESFQSVQGRPA